VLEQEFVRLSDNSNRSERHQNQTFFHFKKLDVLGGRAVSRQELEQGNSSIKTLIAKSEEFQRSSSFYAQGWWPVRLG
jgi:hypothetical protein